ncbi:MAG: hypothetical protein ACREOZ_03215, partial [Gloeomargaritales cyanobacterium]
QVLRVDHQVNHQNHRNLQILSSDDDSSQSSGESKADKQKEKKKRKKVKERERKKLHASMMEKDDPYREWHEKIEKERRSARSNEQVKVARATRRIKEYERRI